MTLSIFTKIFILFCFAEFLGAKAFLEDKSLQYLENSNDNLSEKSFLNLNNSDIYVYSFKKDNIFYDFQSFVKSTVNQTSLIIKMNKQNSKDEYYSFDNTLEQMINYEKVWKVFTSVDQIFTKIIKVNIKSDKFYLKVENSDLLLVFYIEIMGEPTPFTIKLNREQGPKTDESIQMKNFNDKITNLESKLAEMEKKLSNRGQEIFSFISEYKEPQIISPSNYTFYTTNYTPYPSYSEPTFTYLENGNSTEFPFEVTKSGQIDISFELECYIEPQQNPHFYSISLEFTSKSDCSQKMKFMLYNQQFYLGSVGGSLSYSPPGNVLSITKTRSINLLKGSYSATMKFQGGMRYAYGNSPVGYNSKCQRLIIKRSDK